mgnify:CR=1 FL=1
MRCTTIASALLEAYERDGWRGAAKEKLKPVEVSRSRPGSGLGSTSRGIGVARFVADRRLFFLQTQELHRARTSIYEAQMTIRRCFRVFDECGGCKPLPLAAFEGGGLQSSSTELKGPQQVGRGGAPARALIFLPQRASNLLCALVCQIFVAPVGVKSVLCPCVSNICCALWCKIFFGTMQTIFSFCSIFDFSIFPKVSIF